MKHLDVEKEIARLYGEYKQGKLTIEEFSKQAWKLAEDARK